VRQKIIISLPLVLKNKTKQKKKQHQNLVYGV